MEEPKKEFIQGIADLFEDYEEAYVPGEWEAFSKQKKKKYPFAPVWVKIAAILILVGAVILYQLNDPAQQVKKVELAAGKNSKAIIEPVAGDQPVPVLEEGKPVTITQKQLPITEKEDRSVRPADIVNGPDVFAKAKQNENKDKLNVNETSGLDGIAQQVPASVAVLAPTVKNKLVKDTVGAVKPDQYIVKAAIVPARQPADSARKMNTMDFLLAESRNPVKSKKKKDIGSKWDFGVAVAPSITRSNMNIGGGVTTAYRLSDKFSLSSGVSVMQLESGNTVSAPSMAKVSISSLSQKQLLAVDANIKAIDIPVGIVYQISKDIYTSAGVSYFNVLSEKRSITYGLTSQASEAYANPATGLVQDREVLNSVAVEEPVAETPLKGNSYLGFFNFSIGRKQQIFNKYNVLIEPFIKVPIGKLSTQDLNLMNSGLKFQLSF